MLGMADASDLAAMLKQGLISESAVVEIVDAYLSDPTTTLFITFDGHRLNLAEAVRAHPFAQQVACTPWISQKLKRHFVRRAILLARPVEA